MCSHADHALGQLHQMPPLSFRGYPAKSIEQSRTLPAALSGRVPHPQLG